MPSKPPSVGAKPRKYPKAWDRLSETVRATEPLCRLCAAAGRTTAAVCVDHMVPIAAGGSMLDPANLQPLCKSCHERKTEADKASEATRGKHGTRVRIVCGPPGAGKTRSVATRFAPGDVIYDMDSVAAAIVKTGPWAGVGDLLPVFYRVRDALLEAARDGYVPGTLWVIVTDLDAARDMAARYNATLDIVATPVDVCLERIMARPVPEDVKRRQHAAIAKWHASYQAKGAASA